MTPQELKASVVLSFAVLLVLYVVLVAIARVLTR